ncbi:sensor histidine kinase [Mucilaginibacter myungsuensis]|uniref:Histidine kinase n=1 Tax=Mucilaginibacter myungsuensis TaxID=649104 RepID=A0A929L1X9_9SPHI|nr:histidine kinase [Mucilaginibacter myungsuensis]MBE9664118.1 histidine kinase [Mucilaginibacter myungsuensis]MDN3601297.1 histidine kinase [Mucilaginibacter myungsuensis]
MLLLTIVASFQAGFAQQQTVDLPYIRISTDDISTNGIKTGRKGGGVVTLYTVGGYLKIYMTDTSGKTSYWVNSRPFHQEVDREANQSATSAYGSLYLDPGRQLTIDINETKSGAFLAKYIVKRPRLIPEVAFYHQDRDSVNAFYNLRQRNDRVEKLSMAPGTLDLKAIQTPETKGMEVQYFLVNDRTKEQQSATSTTGFATLDLEPNAVYRLSAYYTDQNESMVYAYLFVKPYWYKSTVAYINYALVIIGLIFFAVVRSFKLRIRSSQKENKQLEQSAIRLRSQLNPHFTFNALSSVQGLMNTGRIEEANTYLEEFGSLLRKTLVKSNEVFNSLDQELEMMRAYIRLEALRFNFKWEIQVSGDIDRSGIEIPTLILQPLIENAIKHGLSSLGDEGQLLVSCVGTDEKDTFAILIKDNGTWIERETGYGLSLTADLIKAVNELKTDGRISLQVLKTTGTTVILTFHNWMNN